MRWNALAVLGVLALAIMAGCKEQCFVHDCDLEQYSRLTGVPDLECKPGATILPSGTCTPAPATVLQPERPSRYITLAEAFALALERGTPGNPLLNGTTADALLSYQARSVLSPENPIRVLALQPAITATDIESSLSKFDARWTTSMTWSRTNQPVATPLQTFESGGLDVINQDNAVFTSSLLKPLPTGGVAGITFTTNYELTNLPARVNPSYQPILQFQFEQPLLQGFGVDINQLRDTHPGSILTPYNNTSRTEGIILTRLRFDQERTEFERQVHVLLVNVEVAYWNLYGSYWNLYTREQALQQSLDAWRIVEGLFQSGKSTTQDVAEIRGQYESFRVQRIEALGQVLENEHQLRGLLGLPTDDGTRLVPLDQPTTAPYQPDWPTALGETLSLRPELMLARQDLTARQLELRNVKNLTLPDLRLLSTYDINGIGTELDGGASNPNNAFHSLATNQFHDWQIGLRLDMPIGARDANSAVRAARLRLAQSYLTLRDQEDRARRFLEEQYRAVIQAHTEIDVVRSQRLAFGRELQARFQDLALHGVATTSKPGVPLSVLLESQRFWADALRSEYTAIVDYNNALARFEFAKGTIMSHDNVYIAEGPLPRCAQVRAVEHERQREKAIVLHERAVPVTQTALTCPDGKFAGLPNLPASTAPALPSLFAGQPALDDVPTATTGSQAPASGTQTDDVPDTVSLGQPRACESAMEATPAPIIQAGFTWHQSTAAVDLGTPVAAPPASEVEQAGWWTSGSVSPR
ncbi:MAG TPA: TolC family protein [Gemmataceae bacterium]|nr:TolC family protein [Gemmataceae bacterium]